jgi:hypothetical protein
MATGQIIMLESLTRAVKSQSKTPSSRRAKSTDFLRYTTRLKVGDI